MKQVLISKLFHPFRSNSIPKSEIRSILVLEFTHLGDLVLSFPLIRELRILFPECKIDVACGSWGKEILELNPDINEIIIFDHPLFNRGQKNILWPFKGLSFLFDIRKRQYDLSIELRGNLGSALIHLLSGSQCKVGRDPSEYGYPYSYRITDFNGHEALSKLKLLRYFSHDVEKPSFQIQLDPQLALDLYQRIPSIKGRRFIVCHLSSGWFPKNWNIHRFSQVIETILREFDIRIVLIGTQEDALLNAQIVGLNPEKIFDLSGVPLRLSAIAIKECQLFLGADSGPMHLAAALGVAVIALMGPAQYPRFAPYNPQSYIDVIRHHVCEHQNYDVKRGMGCYPLKDPQSCLKGVNICMQSIKVEEVLSSLRRYLQIKLDAH